MAKDLSDREWMAMLNVLVSGAIRGLHENYQGLQEAEPGKFPPLNDSVMFDVASVLAATLLDANPEYQDRKRFGKAADMSRSTVLEYLRIIRGMSELAGSPMLFAHLEPAGGPPQRDQVN